MVEGINHLAVLAAATSAFVLGGLWYSPILFGKIWGELAMPGVDPNAGFSPLRVFGGSFVLSLLGAYVFAMFLGPDPETGFAVGAGFSAGLAWVAGSFGINYLFERKPFALFAINGGYHTLQYTLFGLMLGVF